MRPRDFMDRGRTRRRGLSPTLYLHHQSSESLAAASWAKPAAVNIVYRGSLRSCGRRVQMHSRRQSKTLNGREHRKTTGLRSEV